ncbi:MAG: choice-of-anchor K domain-containing protein [Fimbriimonadaceae bacterium]
MNKSFKGALIVSGLVVAAISSATAIGTTSVPQTCFNTLTGNLSNLRLSNNNLVVNWGSKGDCLYFTPTSFNAPLGQAFKVGRLCIFNVKDKYDQNGSFNVNLQVGIKFDVPGQGLLVCTLPISHTDVRGANDHTTLPTTFQPKNIVLNGRNYTFSLLGFKSGGASSASVGDWVTPGGTTTCLDLFGKLEAAPVPEPASMAALGLGVAALLRRRRK